MARRAGAPPKDWHAYDLCVALTRPAFVPARPGRPVEVHVIGMPADPHALERMRAAGARRAIHWLPTGGRSTVERALEGWGAAIADVGGG